MPITYHDEQGRIVATFKADRVERGPGQSTPAIEAAIARHEADRVPVDSILPAEEAPP